MKRHTHDYKWTDTTDAPRVQVEANVILNYYTRTLPDALNGTHPSLIFNMDELGAEMFADRKRVFVFLLEYDDPTNGLPMVGVPRLTRRCTLIGCISLDGARLCPAVITKTKTINSAAFAEGGYTSNLLKNFSAENSFIDNDVFGEWLCDVLIPEIEGRRTELRQRLGAYNEKAVLILDGLKCTQWNHLSSS